MASPKMCLPAEDSSGDDDAVSDADSGPVNPLGEESFSIPPFDKDTAEENDEKVGTMGVLPSQILRKGGGEEEGSSDDEVFCVCAEKRSLVQRNLRDESQRVGLDWMGVEGDTTQEDRGLEYGLVCSQGVEENVQGGTEGGDEVDKLRQSAGGQMCNIGTNTKTKFDTKGELGTLLLGEGCFCGDATPSSVGHPPPGSPGEGRELGHTTQDQDIADMEIDARTCPVGVFPSQLLRKDGDSEGGQEEGEHNDDEVFCTKSERRSIAPGDVDKDNHENKKELGVAGDGGDEENEGGGHQDAPVYSQEKEKEKWRGNLLEYGEGEGEGEAGGEGGGQPEEFEWGARKHVLVLSSAGKPIFSLHGDEQELSTLMGLIQGLLSLCQDCGDEMESMSARGRLFVFLRRGGLVLVGTVVAGRSGGGEDEGGGCEVFLRLQLEYLYATILFLLTSKIHSIFNKSPSYDLRTLLGGADSTLRGVLDLAGTSRGRGRMLSGAVETTWMMPDVRAKVVAALSAARGRVSECLFGVWLCGEQVVAISQLRQPLEHRIHTQDLLLLANFVETQMPALRRAESWTPVCLPRFHEGGYLYAYIAFLEHPENRRVDDDDGGGDSSNGKEKEPSHGGDKADQPTAGGEDGGGGGGGVEVSGHAQPTCLVFVSAVGTQEQFQAFRQVRKILEERFTSILGGAEGWDLYLSDRALAERRSVLCRFCSSIGALHFYYRLVGRPWGNGPRSRAAGEALEDAFTQCLSSPFADTAYASDPDWQRRVWGLYTRGALRLRHGSSQEGWIASLEGVPVASPIGRGGGIGSGAVSGAAAWGGENGERGVWGAATLMFEEDPCHSLTYEVGEVETVVSLRGEGGDDRGGRGGGGGGGARSGGGWGWGKETQCVDEIHVCFPSSVPPSEACVAANRLMGVIREDKEWLFLPGEGSESRG